LQYFKSCHDNPGDFRQTAVLTGERPGIVLLKAASLACPAWKKGNARLLSADTMFVFEPLPQRHDDIPVKTLQLVCKVKLCLDISRLLGYCIWHTKIPAFATT
jgi:hypothetical protein